MEHIKKIISETFNGEEKNGQFESFSKLDDNINNTVTFRDSPTGIWGNSTTGNASTKVRNTYHPLKTPHIPNEAASLESLYAPYGRVFNNLPKIITQRLILRPANIKDANDIYEYSKDEKVAEHVLWSAHKSLGETKQYLKQMIKLYKNGSPSSFVIVLKSTGRVIGTIGFMSINPEHSSAEVGYSMARDMWGKGIMTEALKALIGFGFQTLRLNRIDAMHDCNNPSSGRVMQKCGMKFEGCLRQKVYNKGKFVDVNLYSILWEDYKKEIEGELL
ncbi:MAG: GNAT family N-acetyltransferase [Christensenellaceae bacterium]|nr:GNAT family N-acetyltransferase [Christensenellaceae bacterium]